MIQPKTIPLTSMIPPEVLINGAANTILYEQEPAVHNGLFKLFATNHSPQSQAGTLRELLCCLPKVWVPDSIRASVETGASPVPPKQSEAEPATTGYSKRSQTQPPSPCHSNEARSAKEESAVPALSYENIFRVIIMQFIDAHSFDVRSVKKTCVHIVHPDGRLIPFDTYNLFYRDALERDRLTPLRQNAELALAAI